MDSEVCPNSFSRLMLQAGLNQLINLGITDSCKNFQIREINARGRTEPTDQS